MTNSTLTSSIEQYIKITKKYQYIVFEGMDGAGKNTQSNMLARFLKYPLVSFPRYETETGKMVRKYLTEVGQRDGANLDKVKLDSMIYTLDRVNWAKDHYYDFYNTKYVFDRYYTSNMLFQTLNLSVPDKLEYLDWLINLETTELNLPIPDIVFVLVADPEKTMKNIKERGRVTDFFETLDMQKKVYNNALFIANHVTNWKIIHVTDDEGNMRSKEDIHNEVLSYLI